MTHKPLPFRVSIILNTFLLISIQVLTTVQSEPLQVSETDKKMLESLMAMGLEELMNVNVISASKTAQKTLEAPSSMTVFSRQELIAMGITSVEELLNFVPGFQATREMIYNQGYRVVSRGQSTPQTSYNVLFMIDGQRLNTDFTGGALATNHFLTLANVKQVEVIRGPGSALYGTSAFTGVVNIITTTDSNNAFASGGNLNSQEFYTNLSHSGKDWQTSFFARYFHDEGQTYGPDYLPNDPYATQIHDPRWGKEARLNLAWNQQVSLSFQHTERQLEDFLGGRNLSLNGVNFFNSEQDMVALKYHLLDTEQQKMTWYGQYSRVTTESTNGYLVKNTIAQELSFSKEHEWLFGIDGYYRLNPQHDLSVGVEWRQPTLTDRYMANTDFATGDMISRIDYATRKRNVLGLYLQDQYHISDALEATLGVRYDHYSDFGNTTNPRLALVYAMTPETKFKLMYGQAFRAPSYVQLWAAGFSNPNLRPETVKTAELAWLQQYATVQTTLTHFWSRTEDRIDTVLKPGTGRMFANLSNLDTAGWELETSFKRDNVFLRLAYTYLTKTTENPRNVSNQMFSAIANYQYGDWNVNLNGYYHDDMEQDIVAPKGGFATFTMADYWVWNGALRYNWNKHLTFVGRVQNLADEEFVSPTKSTNFVIGLPNRGRTYSVGVEVQF